MEDGKAPSVNISTERRARVICKGYFDISGFGGLEVSCWPSVPKFAGSNPAEAVGFLRVNKNPQHVEGHGYLL